MINRQKILVVGDLMLDRYWKGSVNRISPEAPVPIIDINLCEDKPGGAANVSKNLSDFGMEVTLVGIIGKDEVADDLKKNGGYVPGVRPGDPTAKFLDFVMTRLTAAGAIFLTLIAVFPDIIFTFAGVSYNVAMFFGGTGLLIIVGVVLDTMRQIETFLLQRHYDGFLRKGRLRGRSAAPQGQGIESLELKEFEAQWRPLLWISVLLFLFGLVAFVL